MVREMCYSTITRMILLVTNHSQVLHDRLAHIQSVVLAEEDDCSRTMVDPRHRMDICSVHHHHWASRHSDSGTGTILWSIGILVRGVDD